MSSSVLTLRQLNRATLARQWLLARERQPIVPAVEHLLALQAQLARPPFVALWSRLAGFTRTGLGASLAKRTVVRATSLRGTIHLTSSADFLRFRPCLQPGLDAGLVAILKDRTASLDMKKLMAVAQAFFSTPRTFDAFRSHLEERFPKGDVRAMAYAIRLTLPVVQVPTDATWSFPGQADFIAADTWLGKASKPCAQASALVERYLAAYGPATLKDMQAWLGLRVQTELESIRDRLVAFTGPGRAQLFDLRDAPRPDADVPAPVRFLPDYDSAIVARSDERFVAKAHRPAIFLPGLRLLPTVLVDGVAAGTWRVERATAAATLSVDTFATLPPKSRKAVEAEGDALLEFLEPDATKRTVAVSMA
jgi:hypothetical protein